MILPKTWKHWCKDQRLKPQGDIKRRRDKGRGMGNWFYLQGRGYLWRVNCNACLQIGDTYKEFDRWALCSRNEFPIPQTRKEFKDVVKKLLEAKAVPCPRCDLLGPPVSKRTPCKHCKWKNLVLGG